jgi:hypothetical protein
MSDTSRPVRATGSCLCGGVKYEVRGPMRAVSTCHCSQCRKTTGHYYAATAARRADFVLVEDTTLKWFQSSDKARRGFCGECGSTLFFDGSAREHISILAGTLDGPTGLSTTVHIYVDDAGDYYSLDDGLPQWPQHWDDDTAPAWEEEA